MWTHLSLFVAVLPFVLGAPTDDTGKIWAVLVAGSNTWDNYRHQADVCHAYQIFREHGVPDSQIIVMMYDDIANNDENPNKGVIINQPNGTNVYTNVPKDYVGDAVNIKNFVHVLTGKSAALKGVGSGKVLKSGPNDHVFINFVDHGAPGIIGFPNEYMYSDQLISALTTMHKKKMYKKLVFYLESCESGSMFKGLLPTNTDVFATTAANSEESSWGTYCENVLNTCLGDLYSVTWMEDIDAEDKKGTFITETLMKQFKIVKKKVNQSHVQKFGDMSFKSDELSEVFGNDSTSIRQDSVVYTPKLDVVPSRDIPLHNLKMKIKNTNNINNKNKLQRKLDSLLKGRKIVDDLFNNILDSVSSVESRQLKTVKNTHFDLYTEMFPCYRTLVDAFNDKCVDISKNTYTMSHLYKLANLCTLDNFSPEEVLQIYSAKCTNNHRGMSGVN